MSKLSMRIMFCAIPALLVSFIFGFMNVVLGVIMFVGLFGFGWQVTTPRKDRGEF